MLRPTHATSLFLVLLASGARLVPGTAQDANIHWGTRFLPTSMPPEGASSS